MRLASHAGNTEGSETRVRLRVFLGVVDDDTQRGNAGLEDGSAVHTLSDSVSPSGVVSRDGSGLLLLAGFGLPLAFLSED